MLTAYEEIVRREIVTTRVFGAPPALVFRVWTDPEQLQLWWGPHGFTNTFHHFDPRPGGIWRFTMHGPDGKNYVNEVEFVAIDELSRIVLEHVSQPRFRLTVLFEELGAGTKVTWRQLFETEAVRDAVSRFAVQGNEDNLDRLAAQIAQRSDAPHAI